MTQKEDFEVNRKKVESALVALQEQADDLNIRFTLDGIGNGMYYSPREKGTISVEDTMEMEYNETEEILQKYRKKFGADYFKWEELEDEEEVSGSYGWQNSATFC